MSGKALAELTDADLMTLFKREPSQAEGLPFATDDENVAIATTYWGMLNARD